MSKTDMGMNIQTIILLYHHLNTFHSFYCWFYSWWSIVKNFWIFEEVPSLLLPPWHKSEQDSILFVKYSNDMSIIVLTSFVVSTDMVWLWESSIISSSLLLLTNTDSCAGSASATGRYWWRSLRMHGRRGEPSMGKLTNANLYWNRTLL